MELLLVQLNISRSAMIKEVPQILDVLKVSLFISVPMSNYQQKHLMKLICGQQVLPTSSSPATSARSSANPSLLRSRIGCLLL